MYVGYRPSQQYRLKYEDIFTTGSQTPMLQITQRQRKNVCLHINHTFRFSGECVICFLTTIYDRIPQGHPCLFSFESKRKYENIAHSPYLETESKTQKTNTIATSNLVPMFLFDARLFSSTFNVLASNSERHPGNRTSTISHTKYLHHLLHRIGYHSDQILWVEAGVDYLVSSYRTTNWVVT